MSMIRVLLRSCGCSLARYRAHSCSCSGSALVPAFAVAFARTRSQSCVKMTMTAVGAAALARSHLHRCLRTSAPLPTHLTFCPHVFLGYVLPLPIRYPPFNHALQLPLSASTTHSSDPSHNRGRCRRIGSQERGAPLQRAFGLSEQLFHAVYITLGVASTVNACLSYALHQHISQDAAQQAQGAKRAPSTPSHAPVVHGTSVVRRLA
eukprot:6195749-Pleurochrysis_carterae.AAC.6